MYILGDFFFSNFLPLIIYKDLYAFKIFFFGQSHRSTPDITDHALAGFWPNKIFLLASFGNFKFKKFGHTGQLAKMDIFPCLGHVCLYPELTCSCFMFKMTLAP